MKKRSARAIAMGLSTISLASSLAFPIYVEASEDSESPISVPETESAEETQSQESAVAEASEELAELQPEETITSIEADVESAINEDALDESALDKVKDIQESDEQYEDALDSLNNDIENIEKSADAMEEAESEAWSAVTDATNVTEDIKQTTEQAVSDVEDAAIALADDAADKETVDIAVDKATSSVETAKEQFESAEAVYNEKLAEYQAAKDDYNTAVEAYNTNKANAAQDLDEAAKALESAKSNLSSLEEQLAAAQQELINAGAEALLVADENKSEDISSYVTSIIQYYYVPKTQLSDGQTIDNFKAEPNDSDYISISYDILDADGNYIRTITADYGYTVAESGEISLYANNLVYRYTDAEGKEVVLTQEEASKLEDGRIAIDTYWTATGFYIPRYTAEVNYQGRISAYSYSDAKAINQGKTYLENLYNPITSNCYNTVADFISGTRTDDYWFSQYKLDLNYNLSYDLIEEYSLPFGYQLLVSYNDFVSSIESEGGIVLSSRYEYLFGFVRYVSAYELDEAIKNTKYSSYDEALSAVISQARRDNGASTIDIENSKGLSLQEQTVYAKLEEVHKNLGKALFSSSNDIYQSYISQVSNKLKTYNSLLSQIAAAKSEYEQAQEKVSQLQQQIEELNAANEIDVAEKLTRLELELEKAQNNYETAKTNLESAETALAEIKTKYEERYSDSSDSDSSKSDSTDSDSSEDTSYISQLLIEPELEELPEEILLPEIIEAQEHNSNSSGGHSDNSTGATLELIQPEDVPQEPVVDDAPVTIEDEATPQAITLAGLLARGKWFVGLAGVSTAGAGVAAFEAKRRAAIKLIDKLNQ